MIKKKETSWFVLTSDETKAIKIEDTSKDDELLDTKKVQGDNKIVTASRNKTEEDDDDDYSWESMHKDI